MSAEKLKTKRGFGKSMAIATGIGAGSGYATGMAFVGYLHREKSHGAIEFSRPIKMAARVAIWTFGVRGRGWAAMHRVHHEESDTPKDPHSPANSSVRHVLLHNQGMARKGVNEQTDEKLASDLKPDKWDKLVFDRGKLGIMAGIAIQAGLNKAAGNNPAWGVYSYLVSAGVTAAVQNSVNAMGHGGVDPAKALLTGEVEPYPDGTIYTDYGPGWLLFGETNQRYHHEHPESIVFAGGSLANQLKRDPFGLVLEWAAEHTPLAKVGTGIPTENTQTKVN